MSCINHTRYVPHVLRSDLQLDTDKAVTFLRQLRKQQKEPQHKIGVMLFASLKSFRAFAALENVQALDPEVKCIYVVFDTPKFLAEGQVPIADAHLEHQRYEDEIRMIYKMKTMDLDALLSKATFGLPVTSQTKQQPLPYNIEVLTATCKNQAQKDWCAQMLALKLLDVLEPSEWETNSERFVKYGVQKAALEHFFAKLGERSGTYKKVGEQLLQGTSTTKVDLSSLPRQDSEDIQWLLSKCQST